MILNPGRRFAGFAAAPPKWLTDLEKQVSNPKLQQTAQQVATAITAGTAGGKLRPLDALASFYDTLEIRTHLTPPNRIAIRGLDDAQPGSGGSSTGALAGTALRFVRPTFILSGPSGRKVIAPWGEADADGGSRGQLYALGVVGGLVGLGFLLGRASKRR